MIILINLKTEFDFKIKEYIENNKFNVRVIQLNSIYQINQLINRYGLEKIKIFYSENIKDDIYNNFKYIIYKITNLIDIDNILKEKDPLPSNVPKIKDLITFELNKKLNINDIYNLLVQSKLDISDNWNLINNIIDELKTTEKTNIIKLIGYGRFSLVFKIKSKIIKIGYPRFKFKTPFSNNLIKPIYRKELNNLYIEVQEKVINNWYLKYSKEEALEEVYQIFKCLRDENIFWIDPKPENIGVLIKDNVINYDGNNLPDFDNGIILNNNKNYKIKGEKVITDIDLLYKKDELYILEEIIKKEPYTINSKPMQMFIKLEKRYELEKEKYENIN